MIPVLYVDDDADLLTIGKRYLERSGEFTVNTATSAHEALEILNTMALDAVVPDYQMPDMDGTRLLKAVRKRYPTLTPPLLPCFRHTQNNGNC